MMRRPPVLLVVVAVLLTGVGVGWAASADHEAPSLTATTAEPMETAESTAAPEVSTESVAAAESEPHPVESVEPSVDRVVESVEPLAVGGPGHLEVESAPAVAEPVSVTPTTVPPTSSAAPKPRPSVGFSAQQAYGSCEEPIPYDIFSGTAEPGSTVTISSSYGSGSAAADGSGHWERKVEFPDAPRGEKFSVTVSGVGGSETFDFVATGGSH